MTTVSEVAKVIAGCRFTYANEAQLHDGIAAALASRGIATEREVRLAGGRIDLMAGRVGVEVKVGGLTVEVGRQILRYLACDELDGLVLVTSRVRHLKLTQPAGVSTPLLVVALAGAGL